jgi:hypothetical protein
MTAVGERVFLDRAAVLVVADRVVEELFIPEWQGWVRVGSWDGLTRWRVIQSWTANPSANGRPDTNLLAVVAQASLVGEDGAEQYALGDVPALARKNAKALDRILTVALRINGLDASAVADLGKDSAPTPTPAGNGASTSSLPSTSG